MVTGRAPQGADRRRHQPDPRARRNGSTYLNATVIFVNGTWTFMKTPWTAGLGPAVAPAPGHRSWPGAGFWTGSVVRALEGSPW